ncbi:MAG: hypothetical protein AAGF68_00665 [Pseudomonadota bacterium]
MNLYVSLDAMAATLGVYRGDIAKCLKCIGVAHIPAERIPNDACDGATVKGWRVDEVVELFKRAVTNFSDTQEEYLRSRARRSWRDVKLGVEA